MISTELKECIDTMDLNILNNIKSDSFTVEDLVITMDYPPPAANTHTCFYIMYTLLKENNKVDLEICSDEFKTFFKALVTKFGHINYSKIPEPRPDYSKYNCLCYALIKKFNIKIIQFLVETYPETLQWTKRVIRRNLFSSRDFVARTSEDALYCAVVECRSNLDVIVIIVTGLLLLKAKGKPIQNNKICREVIADNLNKYENGPQILQYLYHSGFETTGVLHRIVSLFKRVSFNDFNFEKFYQNNIFPFISVLEIMNLDTSERNNRHETAFEYFLRVLKNHNGKNKNKSKIDEKMFLSVVNITISVQDFTTDERSLFFHKMFSTKYVAALLPSRLIKCLQHLDSFGVENMFTLEVIEVHDTEGMRDTEGIELDQGKFTSVFELFLRYVNNYDRHAWRVLAVNDENNNTKIKEQEDAMLIVIMDLLIYYGATPPHEYEYDTTSPTIQNWINNDVIEKRTKLNLIQTKTVMLSARGVPRIAQNSPLRLLPKDCIRKLFEEFLE